MSLTVNTLSYTDDVSLSADSYRYYGPNQDDDTNDNIIVKRVAPKPTDTYGGNGRSESKLTRTGTDGASTVIGNGILTISTSFPRDMTRSEKVAMLTDLCTWGLTTEAQSVLVDRKIKQ